jgi:predicted DNA-binding transcriptional regulator AlpA
VRGVSLSGGGRDGSAQEEAGAAGEPRPGLRADLRPHPVGGWLGGPVDVEAGPAMTARDTPRRVDLSRSLWTADDVATALAIKRSTVFELSRRENAPLPSVKIGRAKRFMRDDVEHWLAASAA